MPCGVLPAGALAACLLIVPVCGAQASSVILSPAMEDAFGASSIPLNGTTTLTYTITNPAANVTEDLGVSFTDFIPIGITPFAFGAHAACGGTFPLSLGQEVSLSGGTVAAGDRENPFGSSHFKVRAYDWDPIRAEHYGQRLNRRTNRPDT
jgi:hypothetical protein